MDLLAASLTHSPSSRTTRSVSALAEQKCAFNIRSNCRCALGRRRPDPQRGGCQQKIDSVTALPQIALGSVSTQASVWSIDLVLFAKLPGAVTCEVSLQGVRCLNEHLPLSLGKRAVLDEGVDLIDEGIQLVAGSP